MKKLIIIILILCILAILYINLLPAYVVNNVTAKITEIEISNKGVSKSDFAYYGADAALISDDVCMVKVKFSVKNSTPFSFYYVDIVFSDIGVADDIIVGDRFCIHGSNGFLSFDGGETVIEEASFLMKSDNAEETISKLENVEIYLKQHYNFGYNIIAKCNLKKSE